MSEDLLASVNSLISPMALNAEETEETELTDEEYGAQVKAKLESGEDVTLTQDAVFTSRIVTWYDVELNLDGNNINYTETNVSDGALFVVAAGELTITGEGNINVEVAEGNSGIIVGAGFGENEGSDGASVVFDGPTLNSDAYGISVFWDNCEINILSGNINSSLSAVAGNGSGTHNSIINIKGGNLESENSVAIFHPQSGEINISGGYIEGLSGINMISGSLNISGEPEIVAISGDTDDEISGTYNSGPIADGAAISIINRESTSSYPGNVSINIEGGTFKSESSPIKYYGIKDGILDSDNATSLRDISISGGTFISNENAPVIKDFYAENEESEQINENSLESLNKDGKLDISGGTYEGNTENISSLLPPGYTVNNGEVAQADPDEMDNEQYISFILNELKNGRDVTLDRTLTFGENDTIVINDATFDLGGNTIIVTGKASKEVADITGRTYSYNINLTGDSKICNGKILNQNAFNASDTASFIVMVDGSENAVIEELTIDGTAAGAIGCFNSVIDINKVEANNTLESKQSTFAAVKVYGGTVNITGSSLTGDNGVLVFNKGFDKDSEGANVTLEDTTLEANVYGISTNNTLSSDSNVTVLSGNYSSEETSLIYWPSAGTLELGVEGADDSQLMMTGPTCIEACSGDLLINSGTFIATGSGATNDYEEIVDDDAVPEMYINSTGSLNAGDAVTLVVNREKPYAADALYFVVNGGTFSSQNKYAIRYVDGDVAREDDSSSETSQEVDFTIAGGEFTSINQDEAIKAYVPDGEKIPGAVTGGIFSSDVSSVVDILDDGYVQNEDGTWGWAEEEEPVPEEPEPTPEEPTEEEPTTEPETPAEPETPSISTGSGSSHSGGRNESNRNTVSTGTIYSDGTATGMPVNTTTGGTWKFDADGWWYERTDGSYPANAWEALSWNGKTSWYHFNAAGYLDAGWFTDTDGSTYYLHDVHDNRFGYMYTGWNLINGSYYYFFPEAMDSHKEGSLARGMVTPDGYRVDNNGVWVQ